MRPISIITFVLSAAMFGCTSPSHTQKYSKAEVRQERLKVAEAMFQERCKRAGEKIYRTVENVEGLFLLKVRPDKINFADQFEMDDPYGSDLGGNGYIKNFLRGRDAKGSLVTSGAVKNGYQYVETIDPKDGSRYRYTGSIKEVTHTASIMMGGDGETTFKTKDFVLDRIPATGPAPRYGVTYDDISTREEREYWIAGGSLKVIDMKTNEVLAERVGYMMDRGQGNKSAGRSPWLLAAFHACPSFPATPGGHPFKMNMTKDFVEKVLHIKQEK